MNTYKVNKQILDNILFNPFVENFIDGWDGHIYVRNVKGKNDLYQLTKPLPCGDGEIPINFISDGASVPRFFRRLFPRHRNPIASFRHDFRSALASNDEERKFADEEFKKDVDSTENKFITWVGYSGVRIGAFFGIGSNYKKKWWFWK